MRKIKYHEKKLLKKDNFLDWKREDNYREGYVMHRYHVVGRDDYKKYNGLCRMVQKLVNVVKQVDVRDPFRIEMTDMLLEKLCSYWHVWRAGAWLKPPFAFETMGTILAAQNSCYVQESARNETIPLFHKNKIREGAENIGLPTYVVGDAGRTQVASGSFGLLNLLSSLCLSIYCSFLTLTKKVIGGNEQ